MSKTLTSANTTTTCSAPQGIPMYVRRDGDGYMVTDVIGLRYGWGKCLLHAVEEWASQVEDILCIPASELGDPLKGEVARYRQAIDRPTGPS